jgi:hypothetical protein
MPVTGKPYQSCLIPFEKEILALRRKRPSMAYHKIAELLFEKHNVRVRAPAIFKFLKVRRRGRKVFGIPWTPAKEGVVLASKKPQTPVAESNKSSKPIFKFQYSEHYNLTRVSPEEAAERLKKIEERKAARNMHQPQH